MMRLLRPKFRTFEETLEIMEVEKYSVGDRRRMEVMIDAIRFGSPLKWWRRLIPRIGGKK